MASTLRDHSTLEVFSSSTSCGGSSSSDSSCLESSIDDEKFIFCGDSEKQLGAPPRNLDTPASEGLQSKHLEGGTEDFVAPCHWTSRKKWLAIGVVVVL